MTHIPVKTNDGRLNCYSGKVVNLLDPQPDQIDILDIALALSRQARFNGMTSHYYSVAQHSVLAAQLGKDHGCALELLLHDAAEAYTGDIVKPLKNLLEPNISKIEKSIEAVIQSKFGVDFIKHKAKIKEIDGYLLEVEHRILQTNDNSMELYLYSEMASGRTNAMYWTPDQAERLFIQVFNKLTAS